MLGGEQIQFPLERVRGDGVKLQGENIPLAHTTCHFIQRLLFFFFHAETQRTPSLPLGKPVNWQSSLSWATFNNGGVRKARNPILTLDIEGSVGRVAYLSRDRVFRHALEAPCVQLPVHRSELEVAALLHAPLAVFQPLAVVKPPVGDVGRIADLAPQHGAAAVQSILGFGLLGELEADGLNGQNWREKERAKKKDQSAAAGKILLLFPLIKWRNVMFRQNRAALNYSVVKLSHQTQRKYFFPVSEATETEGVTCHHLGGDRALKQGMRCCTQRTSSSTLAQTLQSFISPPRCCGQTLCQRSVFCSTSSHLNGGK